MRKIEINLLYKIGLWRIQVQLVLDHPKIDPDPNGWFKIILNQIRIQLVGFNWTILKQIGIQLVGFGAS